MISDAQNPDHDFHNFIAEDQNVSVQAAVVKVENFVRQIIMLVNQNKWLELPGIGTLTPGIKDDIKFKSAYISKDYYPDIQLEKTPSNIQKEEPASVVAESEIVEDVYTTTDVDAILQQKVDKDYWWIYALILLLIGIGAIAYYFYYAQPVKY